MKKRKTTLALAGAFIIATALASCSPTTFDKGGNVLTYTDASGNVVGYTADELLKDYQNTGSTLEEEFKRIYEVLIRKYYGSDSQKSAYQEFVKKAENLVRADKETASNSATTNKTSYETELQKILDAKNCENIDELLEYYIYWGNSSSNVYCEKDTFEKSFYDQNMDAIRDGSTGGLDDTTEGNKIFPADDQYGRGNDGWLKESLPYHVRHILVKVGAANGNYTQGEITQEQGQKLSSVIKQLAGVTSGSAKRSSFGSIANSTSEDTGSAAKYGDLGIMADSYINEFRLGLLAFESLFNAENKNSANTYRQANVHKITPGLVKNADDSTDVDSKQVLDGTTTTINQFFKQGETYDGGTSSGVGQIPYGAVVALANASADGMEKDGDNTAVYGDNDGNGKATFFPRNIIFNKYFNKHNVCVITPNEIKYNDPNNPAFDGVEEYDANGYDKKQLADGVFIDGKYNTLPGFQTNTQNILPDFKNNVLTNSEGQIILAVRGGSTGGNAYEGIHLIVVQRDALNEYGTQVTIDPTTKQVTKVEERTAADANTPTLSQYYTVNDPSSSDYPKDSTGAEMNTYVNYNTQENPDQKTRANEIATSVKSYNGSAETYIFQKLVNGEASGTKVKFNDATLESDIQRYVRLNRDATVDTKFQTWSDGWKTYAEMLSSQESARKQGGETGTGTLISEGCAIGFKLTKAQRELLPEWNKVGGACYYAK